MTKLESTLTSSDLTATEHLRRMLDERGVEYETDDVSDSWYEKTTWSSENNLWWTYEVSAIEELPYGTLTLLDTGSNNSMRPAQAIAATLGRGMITADYVRDLIERHSDASGGNGRDFHNGAYVAIADELNATLGPMECRITDSGPWGYPYVCSACGASFDPDVNGGDFNYCPNCGRKVTE